MKTQDPSKCPQYYRTTECDRLAWTIARGLSHLFPKAQGERRGSRVVVYLEGFDGEQSKRLTYSKAEACEFIAERMRNPEAHKNPPPKENPPV